MPLSSRPAPASASSATSAPVAGSWRPEEDPLLLVCDALDDPLDGGSDASGAAPRPPAAIEPSPLPEEEFGWQPFGQGSWYWLSPGL